MFRPDMRAMAAVNSLDGHTLARVLPWDSPSGSMRNDPLLWNAAAVPTYWDSGQRAHRTALLPHEHVLNNGTVYKE